MIKNPQNLSQEKEGFLSRSLIKLILVGILRVFKFIFTSSFNNLRILTTLGLILVAIIVIVFVIRANPEIVGNQQLKMIVQEKNEMESIVEEVGKIIELPSDETPTVATVTDAEKLKDQVFFKKAKNGDKVLIYSNSRKAFLYRPSEKKIIEVGIVSITGTTPTLEDSSSSLLKQNLSFVLLNGAGISKLTQIYEENELKKKLYQYEVVERANASRLDYERTFIVDLKGRREREIKELSEILGIEISGLPDSERQDYDADFLIIIGKDKASALSTPTLSISPPP